MRTGFAAYRPPRRKSEITSAIMDGPETFEIECNPTTDCAVESVIRIVGDAIRRRAKGGIVRVKVEQVG